MKKVLNGFALWYGDRIASRRSNILQSGVARGVDRRLLKLISCRVVLSFPQQNDAERESRARVGGRQRKRGTQLAFRRIVAPQTLFGQSEVVMRDGIRRVVAQQFSEVFASGDRVAGPKRHDA